MSTPGCHRDRSADCATPTRHCLQAEGLGGAWSLPQALYPNSGEEEEACPLCPLPSRRSWGWTVGRGTRRADCGSLCGWQQGAAATSGRRTGPGPQSLTAAGVFLALAPDGGAPSPVGREGRARRWDDEPLARCWL